MARSFIDPWSRRARGDVSDSILRQNGCQNGLVRRDFPQKRRKNTNLSDKRSQVRGISCGEIPAAFWGKGLAEAEGAVSSVDHITQRK